MKRTITLEDRADGTVEVICNPPADILFKKLKEEQQLAPSEAMAVLALSAILNESRWANMEERKIHLLDGRQ